MNQFANSVYEIARKEFMQHMRTKRVLIIGGLMALLLFTVTLGFGPGLMNDLNRGDGLGGSASENVVLSFYFGFGIIGGLSFTILLAVVLTADAVCSEWSNKTIFLLLSKPVRREAFVLGKFLGNVATIAFVIGILFTTAYALMQGFYDGSPSGAEVAAFFYTVLIVILGACAFAAMALFFSTLVRTTAMSMLVTLGLWLIVFPLVGYSGLFMNFREVVTSGLYLSHPAAQRMLYLNPASDMQAVAQLLLPHDKGAIGDSLAYLNFFNPAPDNVGLAVVWLMLYTVVFLGASILVVRRRNFE